MKRNFNALILVTTAVFYFSLSNVQCFKARINGGRNATDNEIKYIVSVKIGKSYCGGGIVDDKFIITAAHCIHVNKTTGKLPRPVNIAAATNTRNNYNKNTTIVIDVVRAFLPAVYDGRGVNDIAILELKESLELEKNEDRLQKLLLPEPDELDTNLYPNYDNVKFKFAGYGRSRVVTITDKNNKIHYNSMSGGFLKVANAIVIDKRTCQKSFKMYISDKRICVAIIEDEKKKRQQGSCRGDSGSPAVIDSGVIIGIDSLGNQRCDNNYKPSIFTRISSYVPFIKNVLNGKTDEAVIYDF